MSDEERARAWLYTHTDEVDFERRASALAALLREVADTRELLVGSPTTRRYVERVEAERDQLRADLAAARAELAGWRERTAADMDAYLDAATWGAREEMHRRALATLAAERERCERLRAEVLRLRWLWRWFAPPQVSPITGAEYVSALNLGDLDEVPRG